MENLNVGCICKFGKHLPPIPVKINGIEALLSHDISSGHEIKLINPITIDGIERNFVNSFDHTIICNFCGKRVG